MVLVLLLLEGSTEGGVGVLLLVVVLGLVDEEEGDGTLFPPLLDLTDLLLEDLALDNLPLELLEVCFPLLGLPG